MNPFTILFPAFCDAVREPDPEFHRQMNALESLGVLWRVVNIDALTKGDLSKALRYFQGAPGELLIYRGWILHPAEYAELEAALAARGCRLLTSTAEYRRGLLFPEFFPAIADQSFPAVWIQGSDPALAMEAAQRLGPPPYFIKDFAKSAKEIWPEGCVVNRASEMAKCIRALRKFRGEHFEGGIVIRPLQRLRYIDEHPFGGNIYEEYRLFFFRGRLISQTAYDYLGGEAETLPDYRFLASRIDSPFFTADVVVTEDGERYVLEVGDGGSSSLPPKASALDFYAAMAAAF
jgi:hypothetical protein